MFVDSLVLTLEGGKGGNGACSFLPYKGGPSGGDGGDGGSIIIQADPNYTDLATYKNLKNLTAGMGQHGGKFNRKGARGKDLYMKVPIGTRLIDWETGELIQEIDRESSFIIAGGKGGRGNRHFATATHQTPREFEMGAPGEKRKLKFDLIITSDVALVGLANSGKTSILLKLTNSKAKVADYPFTTTQIESGNILGVKIIEIPGLIEGANQGHGLGNRFLKHLQKTRLIAYCLEASQAIQSLKIIQNEISLFNQDFLQKPSIVILTKTNIASIQIENIRNRLSKKAIMMLQADELTPETFKNVLHTLI